MDIAHITVIVLILLGAILPVLGVVLAALNIRATLRKHEEDVEWSQDLVKEWNAATAASLSITPQPDQAAASARIDAEYDQRFKDRGLITPSYDAAGKNATGDLAVTRTLRLLAKGNGWNAAIVVAGIIASTIASIWSLALSPV